jgi:hypothetical protein
METMKLTYLGRVVGFVAVELASAFLKDLHGAPVSAGASRNGARPDGRRDVSAARLRQRRLGPRAVLHRRREGRCRAAVKVQLAAELPDARLEQVEAVHERAPQDVRLLLLLLQRRRHRLAVLVPRRRWRRRRAAAGVCVEKDADPAIHVGGRRGQPLLLQLSQLPLAN